ncbi:uncharacterized protein BYT42DRAFT_543780 [Radiomyces spectabilis]|uniref:uncharacterized protein n=1 Tax=Radiomyces spectabilis TaxID=64574 RepID=UPI00221ED0CE|nr:uncharacterized protein BYT42DRAFT_543780 [Radiomyces spectabilis]KAI8388488.1 hypothetical protein BYT42DRAFT_543780 [Radiomyces spectabilis]
MCFRQVPAASIKTKLQGIPTQLRRRKGCSQPIAHSSPFCWCIRYKNTSMRPQPKVVLSSTINATHAFVGYMESWRDGTIGDLRSKHGSIKLGDALLTAWVIFLWPLFQEKSSRSFPLPDYGLYTADYQLSHRLLTSIQDKQQNRFKNDSPVLVPFPLVPRLWFQFDWMFLCPCWLATKQIATRMLEIQQPWRKRRRSEVGQVGILVGRMIKAWRDTGSVNFQRQLRRKRETQTRWPGRDTVNMAIKAWWDETWITVHTTGEETQGRDTLWCTIKAWRDESMDHLANGRVTRWRITLTNTETAQIYDQLGT